MARLKKNSRPLVLTVNGKAEVVVQDAAANQRLMERAQDFLLQSRADADAGRTLPAQNFLDSLGKKRAKR